MGPFTYTSTPLAVAAVRNWVLHHYHLKMQGNNSHLCFTYIHVPEEGGELEGPPSSSLHATLICLPHKSRFPTKLQIKRIMETH